MFELELLPGAPYMTIKSGGSLGFAYALLVLVEKIPGFGGREMNERLRRYGGEFEVVSRYPIERSDMSVAHTLVILLCNCFYLLLT